MAWAAAQLTLPFDCGCQLTTTLPTVPQAVSLVSVFSSVFSLCPLAYLPFTLRAVAGGPGGRAAHEEEVSSQCETGVGSRPPCLQHCSIVQVHGTATRHNWISAAANFQN